MLNGSRNQNRQFKISSRFRDVKFDLEGTPYVAIENIGAGAYGVVCSALDKTTNEKVAIKKTSRIFDAVSIAKRTYREIKILRHFSHPNIISIKSIIVPKEKDFSELYVVFDLMESDLHKILSSSQPLSMEHTQYFLYQLLCGLKYIHSAGVTHRDLKPSNLLVNSNCQLRIGDFGMARSLPPAQISGSQQQQSQPRQQPSSQVMPTLYVATRWYRAPELLLGHPTYTSSVDLWSTGCILAEMLNRAPLFPGTDCIRQLSLIVSKLGPPPQQLLAASCSELIRDMVAGMAAPEPPVPLAVLFPGATRKAVDLVGKLLSYCPDGRLTAEQALGHLFLNRFRNPLSEPTCTAVFDPAALEPPDESKEGLRAAMLSEARKAAAPAPAATTETPATPATAPAPAPAQHPPQHPPSPFNQSRSANRRATKSPTPLAAPATTT
uniref:Mitogen-activated protein kinase n=1 Tax=Macrostomum lignano TaxID=282301 RepID=A0A1I8IZB4_9PLAT